MAQRQPTSPESPAGTDSTLASEKRLHSGLPGVIFPLTKAANRGHRRENQIMGRSLLALGTVVSALSFGCTQPSGEIHIADEWPAAREHLGRTVLLVSEKPYVPDEYTERVRTALKEVPGLELVDAAPILKELEEEQLARPTSDVPLIEAAKRHDVDTVCALWVDKLSYCVGVGILPPSFKAEGTLAYELRLLDARTGRLLIHTQRTCKVYGKTFHEFMTDGPDTLAGDLVVVFDEKPRKHHASPTTSEAEIAQRSTAPQPTPSG
jgi:hypothetical protein